MIHTVPDPVIYITEEMLKEQRRKDAEALAKVLEDISNDVCPF